MKALIRFVWFFQFVYVLPLLICEVVWLSHLPVDASVPDVAYFSVVFGYVAGRVFEAIGS
jgi:hypothetical protein